MQATIQKWGNSQGIRIPKAFLEALGMMENDIVELSRVDDNIVISKVKEKKNLQWVFVKGNALSDKRRQAMSGRGKPLEVYCNHSGEVEHHGVGRSNR